MATAVAITVAGQIIAAYPGSRRAPAKNNHPANLVADTLPAPRSVEEILVSTQVPSYYPTFNRLAAPWVFVDYRPIGIKKPLAVPDYKSQMSKIMRLAIKLDRENGYKNVLPWTPLSAAKDSIDLASKHINDSIAERRRILDQIWGVDSTEIKNTPQVAVINDAIPFGADTLAMIQMQPASPISPEELEVEYDILTPGFTPDWILASNNSWNQQEDLMYEIMMKSPRTMEYAYWLLPERPTLKEDDHSLAGYLQRQKISNVNINNTKFEKNKQEKIHWLHNANTSLQFSQAYISPNWYQGGNNYLSMLFGAMWSVQLNQVWHPKVLFQNTFEYKLGFNSLEDDKYHKYAISQDNFQYNMRFGYKAKQNWYYSVNSQFKTQLLRNYPRNSEKFVTAFLTPGDLNVGVGMTYNKQNKKRTIQFNASLAPISYNLRMALNDSINPGSLGIPDDKRFKHDYGSNADMNMSWRISSMINYRSRIFFFTDYRKSTYGNWENTFEFQFNKYFSTQLYANFRYDSNANLTKSPKWQHWMMKEVLSIGLSYNYSTK